MGRSWLAKLDLFEQFKHQLRIGVGCILLLLITNKNQPLFGWDTGRHPHYVSVFLVGEDWLVWATILATSSFVLLRDLFQIYRNSLSLPSALIMVPYLHSYLAYTPCSVALSVPSWTTSVYSAFLASLPSHFAMVSHCYVSSVCTWTSSSHGLPLIRLGSAWGITASMSKISSSKAFSSKASSMMHLPEFGSTFVRVTIVLGISS